jgi:hypothetical protein
MVSGWRLWLVMAAAAAGATLAHAAPAGVPAAALGKPQVIGAPHYGDTLFNFYQDKTFDALVGLMVSQHFNRTLRPRCCGVACCWRLACTAKPVRCLRA